MCNRSSPGGVTTNKTLRPLCGVSRSAEKELPVGHAQASWEAGNCLYVISGNGNTLPGIITSASHANPTPISLCERLGIKAQRFAETLGEGQRQERRKPGLLPTAIPPLPGPLENRFPNKSWENAICKIFHCTWESRNTPHPHPKHHLNKKKKKKC